MSNKGPEFECTINEVVLKIARYSTQISRSSTLADKTREQIRYLHKDANENIYWNYHQKWGEIIQLINPGLEDRCMTALPRDEYCIPVILPTPFVFRDDTFTDVYIVLRPRDCSSYIEFTGKNRASMILQEDWKTIGDARSTRIERRIEWRYGDGYKFAMQAGDVKGAEYEQLNNSLRSALTDVLQPESIFRVKFQGTIMIRSLR